MRAHLARAAPRRVRNLSGVVLLGARLPGVPPPGLPALRASGSSGRRGFSLLPVGLAADLNCLRSCICKMYAGRSAHATRSGLC